MAGHSRAAKPAPSPQADDPAIKAASALYEGIRTETLSNGLRVREIRRLTDSGHQTAVITTNEALPLLAVARRMFSRWRQENFFRYMRHEFALDHLCTHEVEPADPKRLVTNPERKRLEGQLRAARASLR